MNKPETFVIKAVKKMFDFAGHEYSERVTKEDDWYQKLTWNKKQEDKFKGWFIQNITKHLRIPKKSAEQEFAYFNLMWGFKSKEKPCGCACKCSKKGK